jgi:hypothetical protein
MFSRSSQLALVVKPVIEQIAESLMKAGFKGLIADDGTHVESATSGYNFSVWQHAEYNWIQFTMGINNTINYQADDANKFNQDFHSGKIYVSSDHSGVMLKCDLLYLPDQDITEILGKYIALWNVLVGNFVRSLSEVNSRYEAEQEALKTAPPQPRGALTYEPEVSL